MGGTSRKRMDDQHSPECGDNGVAGKDCHPTDAGGRPGPEKRPAETSSNCQSNDASATPTTTAIAVVARNARASVTATAVKYTNVAGLIAVRPKINANRTQPSCFCGAGTGSGDGRNPCPIPIAAMTSSTIAPTISGQTLNTLIVGAATVSKSR
ncbi:Uncharacterised protein [Mycobacterium tuberculosis]|nr:Uncharacterised protein [Mycobacterium tuberculosis]